MTEQTIQSSDLEFRNAEVISLDNEFDNQGRFIIVTIGINNYEQWPQLRNAVNDAIGIQQVLVDKLGFIAPIPPLLDSDATKDAILNLVEGQLHEILQADDSLLLFFAGHGHTRVDKIGGKEVGETGFIVPVKARKPDPKEYWNDYIEMGSLLNAIAKLPARHILVIIDSCHSGFALGEAMTILRDVVQYEKDLSHRISRKVITSAHREQPACDGGLIPGHSLFAATIIDGFNWGKADLDGNGMITSSELGLFVQQKVGQESRRRQTPDFGSFHLDDRGEMVISLRNQSFDALKARAFSALQNGKMTDFKELVEQVISLRPSSPEALYLEYRQRFFEKNFQRVIEVIDKLLHLNLEEGIIPLSYSDLWKIKAQLVYWETVLEIPDMEFPLEVTLLVGENAKKLEVAKQYQLGDISVYSIEYHKTFQLSIKNPTQQQVYVYMIEIDAKGLFEPFTIWDDEDVILTGLLPGETKLSYPFLQVGSIGICEIRLFSSPKRLKFFLFPPSAGSRSVVVEEHIDSDDLEKVRMKAIRYNMTKNFLST
jgi:Caspase domain